MRANFQKGGCEKDHTGNREGGTRRWADGGEAHLVLQDGHHKGVHSEVHRHLQQGLAPVQCIQPQGRHRQQRPETGGPLVNGRTVHVSKQEGVQRGVARDIGLVYVRPCSQKGPNDDGGRGTQLHSKVQGRTTILPTCIYTSGTVKNQEMEGGGTKNPDNNNNPNHSNNNR
jgi:hypothetical protein